MPNLFDENRFLALRKQSEDALQLSIRARELLSKRDANSFDGFGHFLDAILPDDPARLEHIAVALRLSTVHLLRLRASRLDPLSLPAEPIVLLGQLIGIAREQFERLIAQDHERFAPVARGVTPRGKSDSYDQQLTHLRAVWEMTASNDGSEL
jgi:hypothetical protein